jgi:hypothetical protein
MAQPLQKSLLASLKKGGGFLECWGLTQNAAFESCQPILTVSYNRASKMFGETSHAREGLLYGRGCLKPE